MPKSEFHAARLQWPEKTLYVSGVVTFEDGEERPVGKMHVVWGASQGWRNGGGVAPVESDRWGQVELAPGLWSAGPEGSDIYAITAYAVLVEQREGRRAPASGVSTDLRTLFAWTQVVPVYLDG